MLEYIPEKARFRYRANIIKENSRPRGRPFSLLGDMPMNEQSDEYDARHSVLAIEQDLARFRVDNVNDSGVGYERVID